MICAQVAADAAAKAKESEARAAAAEQKAKQAEAKEQAKQAAAQKVWSAWNSKFGRPTPSTRRCPCDRVCSMAWRFTKVSVP